MKEFRIKNIIFIIFISFIIIILSHKTFAQNMACSTQTPQRSQGLVSTPNLVGKFYNSGGCVVDSKAAFVPQFVKFDDFKSLYYTQSKANKTDATPPGNGEANQGQLRAALNSFEVILFGNNLRLGNLGGSAKNAVVFVEGNLYFDENFTLGDKDSGITFIVKGDVNIAKTVTQVDAVIISGGTICTAFESVCPADNIRALQLTINGSLISLNESSPVKFRRSLEDNYSAPAEKIIHQVKYLVTLRNLLSDTYQKWSEIDASVPLPSPGPSVTPSPSPAPSSSPGSSSLYTGLIDYWNMNETSGNLTSLVNGVNAIATGTTSVAGKISSARLFNGQSDYLTISSTNAYNFANNNFTISLWVKIASWEANSQDYRTLISKYYVNGLTFNLFRAPPPLNQLMFYGFGQNPNQPVFDVRLSAADTGIIADNNWHHIVATRDGNSSAKIYVDGQVKSNPNSTQYGGTLSFSNNSIYIGKYDPGYNGPFNGIMDEIGIWNRSLTTDEISKLYNNGNGITLPLPSPGPSVTPAPTPTATPGPVPFPALGLISYWKMDEVSGTTTVADAAGSNTGASSSNTNVTTAKINNGRVFSGSDSVNLFSSPTLKPTGSVTVAAWVKSSTNNSSQSIFSNWWGGGWKGINLAINMGCTNSSGGKPVFTIGGSSSCISANSSTRVTDGLWHFIAGVFTADGATPIKIYVDGLPPDSSTNTLNAIDYSSNLCSNTRIGRECQNIAYNFDGIIDEVGIWNRALTAEEISNLYNRGNGNQYH